MRSLSARVSRCRPDLDLTAGDACVGAGEVIANSAAYTRGSVALNSVLTMFGATSIPTPAETPTTKPMID